MDITNQSSTTENAPVNTNSSLVTGCQRNDVSFADNRKQEELKTDEKIKSGRKSFDQARDQSRKKTDANTDMGRSGRNKFERNRTHDEIEADAVLMDQRGRDDASVVSERIMMDAAICDERGQHYLETINFFSSERKELTSREEFLAIVSHDLKNPIGAILSYSKLLLEDFPCPDQTKQFAIVIKRNAETSLRLIHDILDMERFAEGKLQLNFLRNDIVKIIEETIETHQHVANERKISLQGLEKNNSIMVDCDRDRIAQVIENLVGNALKYTPKNGVVRIEAHQTKNEVHILVKDTGTGIPMDQQNRIFERYAQIGNKDRQGLGLGLYISKMLIEAHGGKVTVQSLPGRGSTFTFIIPLLKA